eukprot:116749_1
MERFQSDTCNEQLKSEQDEFLSNISNLSQYYDCFLSSTQILIHPSSNTATAPCNHHRYKSSNQYIEKLLSFLVDDNKRYWLPIYNPTGMVISNPPFSDRSFNANIHFLRTMTFCHSC